MALLETADIFLTSVATDFQEPGLVRTDVNGHYQVDSVSADGNKGY